MAIINSFCMIFRYIRVLFGYEPWRRNKYVAAWTDNEGRVCVCCPSRDGFRETYIETGLLEKLAIFSRVDRYAEDKDVIIIDKHTLPISRDNRDNWRIDYNREVIHD